MSCLVKLKKLSKMYPKRAQPALVDISLSLYTGQCIAINGPSGCGKSTLLKIIGLLETPTEGEYWLMEHATTKLTFKERVRLRNQVMGFIFQDFHLIPHLTILENVALPLLYQGSARNKAFDRARAQLSELDLENVCLERPAALSGGQQQRVAIARALVGHPKLILADEPTASLDPALTQTVFNLIKSQVLKNCAVLFVTHDLELSAQCDACVSLPCNG